jgi:hypothetical protein
MLSTMRPAFHALAIATAGIGGLLCACNDTTTQDNGTDDGGESPSSDASSTAADGGGTTGDADVDSGDAAAPRAFVRLAQWSPDTPAADLCLTPQGVPWDEQVPELAQRVAADAGTLGEAGAAGIVFPQVTSYLVIPPGTYSVRLVAGGAADCSAGLVDLASLTAGVNTYTTVAAIGEASPVGGDQALTLATFSDDVGAPAGQIALRFVNASPSPSLTPADLGTGSLAGTGGPFAVLFTGVAFGSSTGVAARDGGAVDANGYLSSNPLATATLSAHPTSAAADVTIALDDVTIDATTAATIALVNGVSNGTASSAAKLLQCADADDSSGASLLATCSIVSTAPQ